MADLINHSLTNQDVSKYNFDTTTQFFNVHVKQKYEAGEQVWFVIFVVLFQKDWQRCDDLGLHHLLYGFKLWAAEDILVDNREQWDKIHWADTWQDFYWEHMSYWECSRPQEQHPLPTRTLDEVYFSSQFDKSMAPTSFPGPTLLRMMSFRWFWFRLYGYITYRSKVPLWNQ